MVILSPIFSFARPRAVLPFLLLVSFVRLHAAETLTEAKVKSAFLYNFAKFVKWPSDTLPGPAAPFTFCTYGENPLQGTLDDVLQGKTIDDRPLLSRHLQRPNDARGCQVLFISGMADRADVKSIANLRLPGLLIVSEADEKKGISKDAAMITFILESNRVRFVIDTKAAGQSGLVISSKLLSLALAVER